MNPMETERHIAERVTHDLEVGLASLGAVTRLTPKDAGGLDYAKIVVNLDGVQRQSTEIREVIFAALGEAGIAIQDIGYPRGSGELETSFAGGWMMRDATHTSILNVTYIEGHPMQITVTKPMLKA